MQATRTVQITFQPQNITVTARTGDTVLDAALDHGIDLPHECGGNCACTTCHIRVIQGSEHLSRMEEPENDRLDTAPTRWPTSRLACQALLRAVAFSNEPLVVACVEIN